MNLIFTRNNLELNSWLIRWGSHSAFAKADAISHCGVLFSNGLFFHSTLTSGVHFTLYESVLKNPGNEIVAILEPKMQLSEAEEKIISDDLSAIYLGLPYDLTAFLYLAKAFFMKKFFNKPLPLKNELDGSHSLLCTEVVMGLSKNFASMLNISALKDVKDSELMWPQKLFEVLSKDPNLKGGYIEHLD